MPTRGSSSPRDWGWASRCLRHARGRCTEVAGVRVVLEKVVWLPGTVAISAKLPQLAPEQRSIRHRLTPPASEEAVQERLTWDEPTALACRFVGSVEVWCRAEPEVVAEARFE